MSACPLNFQQVDATLSRIAALIVASLVGLYLVTENIYILLFLAFDFGMKLFLNKGISPVSMLSMFLRDLFKFEEHMVDGGAKKLAGIFGFAFVIMLILTHIFHAWNLSVLVAAIFLSCSLLDVFFGFCIACKIYFIIKKIYPNFMNNL